jgi:large subunit ribosomal protein L24
MEAMRIKNNDMVQVMSGRDKGKRGRVLKVFPKQDMVLVEGVNKVFKHLRPSRRNPQGGRLSKEMPLAACRVMLVCPQTGKPTRIGVRITADGSKELYSKKSGQTIRKVHGPKAAKPQAAKA